MRYSTISRRLPIISTPEIFCLALMVESITIIKIPTISCITRVPKTSSVYFSFIFNSSNTFIIIVVELIASMPPRQMLFMVPNPRSIPDV